MAGQYLINARIAARKQIVPLTRLDVLHGRIEHVHTNREHRPDGTCYDWRSNGAVKTWKTRPGEFRWPVKYGMYEYGAVTQHNVGDFHRADTCPVAAIDVQYYEALDRGEAPGKKLTAADWGLTGRHRRRGALTGRAR